MTVGIFGRRMPPTEEEKWAAAQANGPVPVPRQAPARPAAPTPAPAPRPRDPLKAVLKAGRMYLRGGNLILDGWQFESEDLPTGPLNGYNTRRGSVAGLTPKQLHDVAEGHGPRCRCEISRARGR